MMYMMWSYCVRHFISKFQKSIDNCKFQFNKGDINIVAGAEVFWVSAGTLTGLQEISFSVESQEGLEKAGTYKGITNFIAQVVSN